MADVSDVIDTHRDQFREFRTLQALYAYDAADLKLSGACDLEGSLRDLEQTFTEAPPLGVGLTSLALNILFEKDDCAASKLLAAVSDTSEITFPSTWAQAFADFSVANLRDAGRQSIDAPVREALQKLRARDEFDITRIQEDSADCALVCEWLFASLDVTVQSEVMEQKAAPAFWELLEYQERVYEAEDKLRNVSPRSFQELKSLAKPPKLCELTATALRVLTQTKEKQRTYIPSGDDDFPMISFGPGWPLQLIEFQRKTMPEDVLQRVALSWAGAAVACKRIGTEIGERELSVNSDAGKSRLLTALRGLQQKLAQRQEECSGKKHKYELMSKAEFQNLARQSWSESLCATGEEGETDGGPSTSPEEDSAASAEYDALLSTIAAHADAEVLTSLRNGTVLQKLLKLKGEQRWTPENTLKQSEACGRVSAWIFAVIDLMEAAERHSVDLWNDGTGCAADQSATDDQIEKHLRFPFGWYGR